MHVDRPLMSICWSIDKTGKMWYNYRYTVEYHLIMTDSPTKTKGSLYKPPTERPEETNIGLADYIEDAKVRWQIHLFEWDEFTKEVLVPTAKTAYELSVKAVDRVKEAYHSMDKDAPKTEPVEKVSTERVGKDMDNL